MTFSVLLLLLEYVKLDNSFCCQVLAEVCMFLSFLFSLFFQCLRVCIFVAIIEKKLGSEIYKNTFITTIKILSEQVKIASQPAITCSKLTIGTLQQGVKYVQS